jgi:hypothetical protein
MNHHHDNIDLLASLCTSTPTSTTIIFGSPNNSVDIVNLLYTQVVAHSKHTCSYPTSSSLCWLRFRNTFNPAKHRDGKGLFISATLLKCTAAEMHIAGAGLVCTGGGSIKGWDPRQGGGGPSLKPVFCCHSWGSDGGFDGVETMISGGSPKEDGFPKLLTGA